MKTKVLFLVLFAALPGQTESFTKGKVNILKLDHRIPSSEFPKSSFAVFPEDEKKGPESLPSPQEVDYWLEKSGLTYYTKSWDIMDKDMLVFSVRTLSTRQLIANYPSIPADRLQFFQKMLKRK